jgi:hypothetical protein
MQDAQDGLAGPPQAKDGTFSPSDITSNADPTAPNGIIDHPVPLAGWGSLYHITNGWAGSVNNQRVTAVAGSKVDDPGSATWNSPEQGMLTVLGIPPSLNGEYLTPSRTGQLQITSAFGTCLSLVSTNNTTYHFDVATRQWSCPPPPLGP